MTLPSTGPLTVSMINAELGRAGNAYFDINGTEERALADVPVGQVSFHDFYGKSRGTVTPQEDYVDPNTLTKTVTWVSPYARSTPSIAFKTDGSIVVDGTPGDAFPSGWYTGGTPPPGFRLLATLVSFTTEGAAETTQWSYTGWSGWWDLSGGDFYVWAQVESTAAITTTTKGVAVFDISLSDGTATVVSFRLTVTAELTA